MKRGFADTLKMHIQVMWCKYLEMEGKRHEVLRVIEYLLPKETNRLAVLGNACRLHTDLVVSSDTVATLQSHVQRNGYSWFISETKYADKALFMTHICHLFMYTRQKPLSGIIPKAPHFRQSELSNEEL
jgi:hypothetical protein